MINYCQSCGVEIPAGYNYCLSCTAEFDVKNIEKKPKKHKKNEKNKKNG